MSIPVTPEILATSRRFDQDMRDLYAEPGTVLKQWVVDARANSQWANATCPRVIVPMHRDNTGFDCRNAGRDVPWHHLNHDSCYECNDLMDKHAGDLDIAAWIMERAVRPPVCADHSKLSDLVASPLPSMRDNPLMQWVMARK